MDIGEREANNDHYHRKYLAGLFGHLRIAVLGSVRGGCKGGQGNVEPFNNRKRATMTRYLAFDIETAKITPDGDDIQNHRPLGISCWAVARVGKDGTIESKAGHGVDEQGKPAPQMSQTECRALISKIWRLLDYGYILLTHNGVGFDLDILAEESGMHQECADLAMNSVDTCLQIHCMKGFPVGLDAICKGMGLSGKTEGIGGSLAPVMWAEGKYDEVLAYVAQDVRCTLEVALEIEKRRSLSWISKSGRRNSLAVPKLLTVREALQLPEPNTAWMTEPMPRSRFTNWMEAEKVRIG